MKSEEFRPTFDWLTGQGVEAEQLETYFDRLYEKYTDIFDLHILCEKNKLPEARDFSNIRFNAMMKLVVMDALTDFLHVDEQTKERLCRATVVPNWDLHFRKRPQDYTPGVLEELQKLGEKLDYDHDLVSAAGPDFFTSNRVDSPDVTREELLMLLVSDLVDEREIGKPTIMDVDNHIDFKIIDRPDLDKETYWERERAKDHEIMREFFPMIPPELFPTVILRHIMDMV